MYSRGHEKRIRREVWVWPGLISISFLHERLHPIDTTLWFASFTCQYVLGISPYQFLKSSSIIFLELHST